MLTGFSLGSRIIGDLSLSLSFLPSKFPAINLH